MKSLDVTIRLPPELRLSVPEADAPGDDFVREELLSWHAHDDGVVYFLSLVVGDPEAIRSVLGAVDAVRSFDLTRVDDDTCYVHVEMDVRPGDRAWLTALDGREIVVVPPVVFGPDGEIALTVLGDPEELRQVVADFPEDIEVAVDRVGEHRHLAGSLAGRLTARQFEAVEVARELGYYEVPRETELAAVAAELDCTESTASALLRKAERALVDAALVR
ncbi:helix-turn-helix domain-containing protein [Halorussus litoreus]|uniref:helix-turn-helix domain-containing protein n=1 Tax=Halorussus litoreus TaxID=1710536 RepID=UPI000E22F8DC|nr:helix-turn-helix domain-containing protein [Halorussus litoreus]